MSRTLCSDAHVQRALYRSLSRALHRSLYRALYTPNAPLAYIPYALWTLCHTPSRPIGLHAMRLWTICHTTQCPIRRHSRRRARLYMPCALLGADAWFKKSLKRWKFPSGDIVGDIGPWSRSDSSGSLMITLESVTAAHSFWALLDKACKSVQAITLVPGLTFVALKYHKCV